MIGVPLSVTLDAEQLDRLRERYAAARWHKDLKGDYAYVILPKSEAELRAMAPQFAEILFFDSHYELNRAKLMGGLVAIRKRRRDR